ncbi:hypothetical protein GGF46_001610 [Coemansia sp. RSA 552]|nr:hypothetical protein GGF46_001610 [Coemansia sp. RSA 552]
MASRKYDIVLLGAAGFTGRLTFEQLVLQAPAEARLAISDLDQAKMEALRAKMAARHTDMAARFEETDIIVANTLDAAQMHEVAAKTRVLVTAVGPYILYGDEVVRACIDEKTDYCDCTGEVAWILNLHQKLNEQAVRNNVCLATMCGFDCIPADIGCFMLAKYAREKYDEPLLHVDGAVKGFRAGLTGGTIHTMATMVGVRLGWLWKKLTGQKITNKPKPLPTAAPNGKESKGGVIRYNKELKRWQTYWIMTNMDTATAKWAGQVLNYGPGFAYSVWMNARGLGNALAWMFGLITYALLIAIGTTRKLLTTLGVFPGLGEGASEKYLRTGYFSLHLKGLTPNNTVYGKISTSFEVGYLGSAHYLVQSALCMAYDRDESFRTGIYPPSVTMGDALLKRLRAQGFQFDVGTEPIPAIHQTYDWKELE